MDLQVFGWNNFFSSIMIITKAPLTYSDLLPQAMHSCLLYNSLTADLPSQKVYLSMEAIFLISYILFKRSFSSFVDLTT